VLRRAPGFSPRRPQDRAFVGNLVQGMQAYASGALGTFFIHSQGGPEYTSYTR
jgi:hypothetical protein